MQVRLTTRQRQVCEKVILGLTLKQIADELRISPHTADSYLRQCFAAFGKTNKVTLALAYCDWRRDHANP